MSNPPQKNKKKHINYASIYKNPVCFQARCAAQKLFMTLEEVRTDYFKNITEQELYKIPTLLLLHLR